MKKLYLNIVWPVILIGLFFPFSEGPSLLHGWFGEKTSNRQPLPPVSVEPSRPGLNAGSESVCAELITEPGSLQGVLQLPAFDPAKGKLTGVRITTESTLSADIYRSRMDYSGFHALFTAGLKCSFPGELQFQQEARLNYQASISNEQLMQKGISVRADETHTEHREVTESLESFHGVGNLDIPVEVTDLIDHKAENFTYHTQLKAKVCIDYVYEAN